MPPIGILTLPEYLVNRDSFLRLNQYDLTDAKVKQEFTYNLKAALVKAHTLAGIGGKLDKANKDDIATMLMGHYNHLTIQDIEYAFAMDRYNVWGPKEKHFQLFDADYVSRVLLKFQKEMKRAAYLRPTQQLSQQTESAKAMEEHEKKTIVRQGVLNAFADYRATGILPHGLPHVYRYLWEAGVLPKHTDKFRQRVFRKQCKTLYKEWVNLIKKDIEITNLVKSVQKGNTKLRRQCERHVLKTYFDKLINTGQPLPV